MAKIFLDTTPLRESPHFTRLWWGLGVSNFGQQMTAFAVGLEVYSITKSTLAVGVLGFAGLVPLVVLGLYGGALVDAFDRRKLALIASVVLWVSTLVLVAQAALNLENVKLLYALVAIQSAAFALNNPARQAIIPRLLRPELLPAANSLMAVFWTSSLMGAPFLGALAVDQLHFAGTYAIDAVLFTTALYAVWKLPPVKPGQVSESNVHEEDGAAPRKRVGLSSVLDGLRYLKTQPDVRMTFLVDLAAMIFAMPKVLFPAIGYVVLGGGEATVAILTAAMATGALLAGLFSGIYSRATKHGALIVGAITGWGLSVVIFGLVIMHAGSSTVDEPQWGHIALASAALVMGGISDEISALFRQTILQTATPDKMRGRLQGVFIVVVAGGPRLADLLIGAEATWWGEGKAAFIGGITCLVVLWLIVGTQRKFLSYDSRNVVVSQ